MVSSPDVLIEVPLDAFVFELRVKDLEGAPFTLKLLDELLLGPELYIVDEQDNMNSPFLCLD